MRGYLGLPEKTADVLRHGWYCTGDVATVDEDGFLQITGRLSRFSKIGGEMVPHLKIEEKLQELAGAAETMFVVAGVPDEKKGERIVVLHRLSPEAPGRVPGKIRRLRPAQSVEAQSRCFLPGGEFPAAGHGQTGSARREGIGDQAGHAGADSDGRKLSIIKIVWG